MQLQKICEKEVSDFPHPLQFIPDCDQTQKKKKKKIVKAVSKYSYVVK